MVFHYRLQGFSISAGEHERRGLANITGYLVRSKQVQKLMPLRARSFGTIPE